MIFSINTTRDISKLSKISLAQRLVKLRMTMFEISLVVFMPNITTNHAITYTNCSFEQRRFPTNVRIRAYLLITVLKMCASLGE